MRAIPQEFDLNQSGDSAGRADCDPVRAAHAALIDPTLPLLAQSWQQSRLVLGDHGRFPARRSGSTAVQAAAQAKGRVAIDLVHGAAPSLIRTGDARAALTYTPNALPQAQAALIACMGEGGWPIARDSESLALLTLAERIASSDIPVLIEGPTGTGKEVFAQLIHRLSPRASGPFVAVNCAAMPESMLEAMLFGHRKGAFTGAGEAQEGLFRAANGGTLLLDEIGELPLSLQSKLLRALQEGEVLPLGATKPVTIDLRIVAATNRTLSEEVLAGRFREDLLYRLNVFPLRLSALRQRTGDIAPLAFGMLLRHACREGMPSWISGQALALLEAHPWPGNVRELENVVRRAILLAGDSACIGSEHIHFDQAVRGIDGQAASAPAMRNATIPAQASSLSDVAFQSEAQAILRALDENAGHRAKTARSLGISERTLRYRLATMRENGLIEADAPVGKQSGASA